MGSSRARTSKVASTATALLLALGAFGVSPAAAAIRGVIVQASSPAAAAAAVREAGGTVGIQLPIVRGVSALVPADAVDRVERSRGVLAVTPDERVTVAESATVNPSTIKSVFNHEIHVPEARAAGFDGSGIRVALVDTGVTPGTDLAGRIARVPDPSRRGSYDDCVNLSGEAGCGDSYGHGTFVAGLIAGNGTASDGRYQGVAPGAQIVSLKIAGADGSADVSKVLAAIQYVVSFASELNIKVLNLSLGTNSPVSYRYDPLNFAVERAWRAGIVVVVAASNRGPNSYTISKPADDPLVISVGAVDDRETRDTADDTLPKFSGRGPTFDGLAKPDVVAPGGRVVSLRAPGSTIEQNAPGGVDATYRRGSGTSMSAGIVSGAAALLAQARPAWSPDRVKFALMSTAAPVASPDPYSVGAGLINVFGAMSAPEGLANQGVTVLADATGTLDAARGDVRVTKGCVVGRLVDATCVAVAGEQTAQGRAYDALQYRSAVWDGSSWYTSQWSARDGLFGSSWYGSSWYGSSWYGSSWYGSSWYGTEEQQTSYGVAIAGSSWYGAWS